MNVGGHRVTNDELAASFVAMGFADPVPYQASGNVLLRDDRDTDARLIEAGLEGAFGYAVPTTVRSAAEVLAIAASEPFPGETKVQVILLDEAPPDLGVTVASFATEDDPLVAGLREIYWLTLDGLSNSSFDLRAFERTIGPFTIRTHATMSRLASKLGQVPPGRGAQLT